jgi:uncharacterized protein YcbK (DUF882 family)
MASEAKNAGKKAKRGKVSGANVAQSDLRQAPVERPSGTIVIRSPALSEKIEVQIYNEDGSFNQEALAQLDHLFRCRQTGEERAMDPRLYEVLSIIYDHYGKEIEINSAFRYQRNEGSRHFHGSAMDVTIPSVSYQDIYTFAGALDTGGMGVGRYPRSNFVHIDFRAPGEPSYRWTDTTHGSRRDPGKLPSKMWRSQRPNS